MAGMLFFHQRVLSLPTSRSRHDSVSMEQEGTKKRPAKRLSVTNVTGLPLVCFVRGKLT